MPIILNDEPNVSANGSANNAAVAQINMSPKEYNSILTGNGVNQGLLRSTLTQNGNGDILPVHVKQTMIDVRYDARNKVYHSQDPNRKYTVLHQDISICGNLGESNTVAVPKNIIKDHFCTFEDANGNTLTYRSRLFLKTLYVYKGVANYAVASYILIAMNETNPLENYVVNYDALYDTSNNANTIKEPIAYLYGSLYKKVLNGVKSKHGSGKYAIKIDDTAALAKADRDRSMYDLIIDELTIIKTPGVLKDVLTSLSANSFESLRYANNILNMLNLMFVVYQREVIDVVNSRTPEEAKQLKNANTSLSLADTLSSMSGSSTDEIPELVGKSYMTTQTVLTTEQKEAIETPSRITIVAAGAGTGKSTSIKHRLSFMEENGCNMKQTVVLSFTKNAASHIAKEFKDCKASTIADFTHSFINIILDDGSHERVDIIAHSDFVQKLKIKMDDLANANVLPNTTLTALQKFVTYCDNIGNYQSQLLDMLDQTLNPEAQHLIQILQMMHCSSLEIDPIIFHTQLNVLTPNIEHIIIDEAQDSNKLEFLTILKMAMMHNISLYIVGDCAQTLYEFRDADPRILNNLTKLFKTYDLTVNHRSTQVILDVANLMSNTMSTHKSILRSNIVMQIDKPIIDKTITINTFDKVGDPATMLTLDNYIEKHIGKGESIAVIARAGGDVKKLDEYLKQKYGTTYKVINITSQRRNDITILSMIGSRLYELVDKETSNKNLNTYHDFENMIKNECVRLNQYSNYARTHGATVNKVVLDWLSLKQPEALKIITDLNNVNTRGQEVRRLMDDLLNYQTKKNNLLQRTMDAKNAKLKEVKADIIVSTVHAVKGLEYDNVACFIDTETGRSYTSDENKRISYVALTRAKFTECIFCTKEKLLKDFLAYREAQPD